MGELRKMFGKLNIISPPDQLFNQNPGYLLVRPSKVLKTEFHHMISNSEEEVNVFIFDEGDTDVQWLLSVSHQVGFIIIDADNCDDRIRPFIGILLMHPNSCYIANTDSTNWELISRNRIYNLDGLLECMGGSDGEIDEFEDEED